MSSLSRTSTTQQDAAMLSIRRGTLRPDLQATIDRIATEDPALSRRYSALVRLSLLVQRARGGSAESVSTGLLTGILICLEDREYAAAVLAEQGGDCRSAAVRASIRNLIEIASVREAAL